jgi:hypothetical protein
MMMMMMIRKVMKAHNSECPLLSETTIASTYGSSILIATASTVAAAAAI